MADPHGGNARRDDDLPLSAWLLGYAGLLPPAIAIALHLYAHARLGEGPAVQMPLLAAIAYGAVILSFLGGMWWGIAVARLTGAALTPWLVLAVMPSLIALPALLIALARPATGAALIGVALVATLLADRRLVAPGLVPRWWLRLRVPLSCGLALLTIAAGLLAG